MKMYNNNKLLKVLKYMKKNNNNKLIQINFIKHKKIIQKIIMI